MAVLTYRWVGKAVSVNDWHGARAICVRGKWRAMIFENTKYKQFKRSIASRLPAAGLSGYFDIEIRCRLYRLFDTSNILKPVQDALVQAGTIEDDRYIRDVSMVRSDHERGEIDEIEIRLYRAQPRGKYEE